MIKFRFRNKRRMEDCHRALVDSQSYKNSEISIVENEMGGFDVLVGKETDYDDVSIYWCDMD